MNLEQALFPMTFERGAARRRLAELQGHVVCTTPEVWRRVEDVAAPPLQVVTAGSIELADLTRLAAYVPDDAKVVVGLGGGISLDTAKWVAAARALDLVQIPSQVSVDAAFSPSWGYRDRDRLQYVGHVVPEDVIVDPELIGQSPPSLNRAGVGDLLSCHTALVDWRLAAEAGQGVPWDEELATIARIVLEELEATAPEIRVMSDQGIGFIAGAHRLVGAARQAARHARFEEGSEHFLSYVIEWLSGRRPAHGELIAFCVLVMSYVQGEDTERPVRIVRQTGIDARPSHLGIDGPLLARCFAELPDYAVREHLDASIIELVELTPGLASAAFAHACEATGE